MTRVLTEGVDQLDEILYPGSKATNSIKKYE